MDARGVWLIVAEFITINLQRRNNPHTLYRYTTIIYTDKNLSTPADTIDKSDASALFVLDGVFGGLLVGR